MVLYKYTDFKLYQSKNDVFYFIANKHTEVGRKFHFIGKGL